MVEKLLANNWLEVLMFEEAAVLVVEDEPIILIDLVDFLQNEGFDVLEAANADEAIQILERNPAIRILITDIDMPGSMDGLKLAAAVRDRWPPIRIIVTSGQRIVEITEMPSGSVFFSKPYQHREVLSSVRELLTS